MNNYKKVFEYLIFFCVYYFTSIFLLYELINNIEADNISLTIAVSFICLITALFLITFLNRWFGEEKNMSEHFEAKIYAGTIYIDAYKKFEKYLQEGLPQEIPIEKYFSELEKKAEKEIQKIKGE